MLKLAYQIGVKIAQEMGEDWSMESWENEGSIISSPEDLEQVFSSMDVSKREQSPDNKPLEPNRRDELGEDTPWGPKIAPDSKNTLETWGGVDRGLSGSSY